MIVVAVGVYYAWNLAAVVRSGERDEVASTEAIVVLGAAQYDGTPSHQLAARLDHAAALYAANVAPTVVVTGGKQAGDRFTEAEASRNYLVARGVPADAILSEEVGTNTYNSLEAASVVLAAHHIGRVVLVTDPYHAERSGLVAKEVGLSPALSPTPTSVVGGWHEVRRDLIEAGGVAVGRVVGFGRLSALTG